MVEFIDKEVKHIGIGEPISFENKTESPFDEEKNDILRELESEREKTFWSKYSLKPCVAEQGKQNEA